MSSLQSSIPTPSTTNTKDNTIPYLPQPQSLNISNFTKIKSVFTRNRKYNNKSPPSSSPSSNSKSSKNNNYKKRKASISLFSGCCLKPQKTLSPHIANNQIVCSPSTTSNIFIYPTATKPNHQSNNGNVINLPSSVTELAVSMDIKVEVVSNDDISLSHSNKKEASSSCSASISINKKHRHTPKAKKFCLGVCDKKPEPKRVPNLMRSNYKLPTDTLGLNGYLRKKQLAPTLQGEVFIADKTKWNKEYLLIFGYVQQIDINISSYDMIDESICDIIWRYYEASNVVIKTAQKSLHFAGVTIKDGNKYSIQEDIVKEARLMKYFMNNSVPSTMIKYHDFFEDDDTFYLVMEKGGIGLFEFTVNAHKMISNNKLDIKYWRKCVKFIFAKMVGFICWMHHEVNCCNLDISLENIVMADDTDFNEKTGKFENLDIRFIDFGLTEQFNKNKGDLFKNNCIKYVGKTGYKAPNVLNKKPFMANKADVWSLGICLFMLSIGAPPFKQANSKDARFEILRDGQLQNMIFNWNRWDYISSNQFDLIIKMLCIDQSDRYNIGDVMKHSWLKVYFGQYSTKNTKNTNNNKNKPCIAESKTNTIQGDHGEYIANLEH